MKVSIITATYNSESNISCCIESIIKQDYKDIELLIIDGISKDRTLEIVDKYKNQYNFIRIISEKDSGIYDALNKGIGYASGDIIGFVHSDDFIASPNIISNVVNRFKTESIDGVYGSLQYVDNNNTDIIIRNWVADQFSFDKLKQGWMPPHPTLYLKKEVYQKYGSYDLSYSIAADYDFILRIFSDPSLSFNFLPHLMIKMRNGGTSNKNLINIFKKMQEDYYIIKKHNLGGLITLLLKNLRKYKQFI